MKIKRFLYLTGILFMANGMYSCEEKIDLQVHDGNLEILVVEGMITSDTTEHYVYLSLTGGFYLEKETPKVSGAQVSILDDLGNEYLLKEEKPGVFKTDNTVYGEPGRTYTLSIAYEDQKYEATSAMPRKVEIDSLSYRWDNALERYRILLYGQEPKGVGDNYKWHIWKNQKLLTDKISKVQLANDEFIDGRYIDGFEVDLWSNDFDFQKQDSIKVTKHTITDETFSYILSVFQERTGGNGGMRAPANIPSNLSNGALGWFHASAVTHASVVIQ